MLIGVFIVAFIYVIYQCLKYIAGSHSTEPTVEKKDKNKNEGGEKQVAEVPIKTKVNAKASAKPTKKRVKEPQSEMSVSELESAPRRSR